MSSSKIHLMVSSIPKKKPISSKETARIAEEMFHRFSIRAEDNVELRAATDGIPWIGAWGVLYICLDQN